MGSSGSKSAAERRAAYTEEERLRRAQEYSKLREAERVAWEAEKRLEEHHRQLRLKEEESLKRNREAWLREANLKEQQQQQEILRQQEIRAQRLLQENKQWDERRGAAATAAVQSEILVRNNLPSSSAEPIVTCPPAAATPNDRDAQVTQKKKSRPRVKKPIANSKVRPEPTIPPLIPTAKTLSRSSKNVNEESGRDSSQSHHALYASAEFPFVEWTEIDYVREMHGVSKYVAENIIAMFDRDSAISFIARYRKNTTLGMDVDQLRNIKDSLRQARALKQKADAFIGKMHERGLCDSALYALARSTKSPSDFEFIESIYDDWPKLELEKTVRASLLSAARAILKGDNCPPLSRYAVSHCQELKTERQVESVVVSLIADIICKEPKTLEYLKILRKKHAASIATERKGSKENAKTRFNAANKIDYSGYYNFSAFEKSLRPDQVLEINRGEDRKVINVRVVLPEQFENDFKEYCEREYAEARRQTSSSDLHQSILSAAFDRAWKGTIEPNICKLTRREMTRRAETALVADIAKYAKRLLLVPPVRNKTVMGIHGGLDENGCVLAVVSGQGQVVRMESVFPHEAGNPSAKQEAEQMLAEIIIRHECYTVALGDGPARPQTEVFLTDLIERPELRSLDIAYAIVDLAPATFYAASSQQSSIEFPFLEAKFKTAVSLAKRLQDPMAELVKIDPRHWNMKIPRHNFPAAKQLLPHLNAAIEEAVSLVGVDVNTGSLPLLKRVAGLNESTARNLIKWRESSGPFRTRNDLKKVQGISDKIFEQCAGFLRIIPATSSEPLNYLDQTCIHPEMYDVAEAFLKSIGCDRLERHFGTPSFLTKVTNSANLGYSALASKFYTSVETMKIIVEGLLMEKDLDARGRPADQLLFRKSLKNLDDLVIGTVLVGVVRGTAHFGSFVDVGLQFDGLIHKSKTGGVALNIGQKVETTVVKFDKERRRLGLALVKTISR